MYLTGPQTKHLSRVMDALTRPMGPDELRLRLAESLSDLLDADYLASYVWDDSSQRFGRGICCHADPAHLRAYETSFQFTDPIALRLRARRYPTLVTQVMPQHELVRTEFFDGFLKSEGLYWGVNLYAHDGRIDLGDMRIWRAKRKQNFDAHEIELLRVLYPSIVNALGRAGDGCAPSLDSISGEGVTELLMRLQQLSRREAQVAVLAAQGHSDKVIARRVGIGFTTVRTHLTNVFRKTGCADRKSLIREMSRLATSP